MTRSPAGRRLVYLTLLAVLFFSAFPLYFSVVVASQDNSALSAVPPPLAIGANLVDNVTRVFETVPFDQALLNSFVVASGFSQHFFEKGVARMTCNHKSQVFRFEFPECFRQFSNPFVRRNSTEKEDGKRVLAKA